MKATHQTIGRARKLRRDMTNAEVILWSRLKGRQLYGWQFRKQHPIRGYIADFACAQAHLVIEIDGETHSTDSERRYDAIRTRAIESEGWTVVRFWNREVYNELDGVLNSIANVLGSQQTSAPPPSRA
jgi:very-short-patch-repair endonuclease